MKPWVKNDSWYYTASKQSARKKIKRLQNKRRRLYNHKLSEKERNL